MDAIFVNVVAEISTIAATEGIQSYLQRSNSEKNQINREMLESAMMIDYSGEYLKNISDLIVPVRSSTPERILHSIETAGRSLRSSIETAGDEIRHSWGKIRDATPERVRQVGEFISRMRETTPERVREFFSGGGGGLVKKQISEHSMETIAEPTPVAPASVEKTVSAKPSAATKPAATKPSAAKPAATKPSAAKPAATKPVAKPVAAAKHPAAKTTNKPATTVQHKELAKSQHTEASASPAEESHAEASASPTEESHTEASASPAEESHAEASASPAEESHAEASASPTEESHAEASASPTEEESHVEAAPAEEKSHVEAAADAESHAEEAPASPEPQKARPISIKPKSAPAPAHNNPASKPTPKPTPKPAQKPAPKPAPKPTPKPVHKPTPAPAPAQVHKSTPALAPITTATAASPPAPETKFQEPEPSLDQIYEDEKSEDDNKSTISEIPDDFTPPPPMSEEERENRKSARFSGFFAKRKSISGVNEFVSKSLKGISKLGASLYSSRSRSTTPMRRRIEGEQNIELTEQELQRRFYDILEIPVGSHKSYTLRISESNPTSAKLVAEVSAAAAAAAPPAVELPKSQPETLVVQEPHVDTPHPAAPPAAEPQTKNTLLNSFSFKFQSPQALQTDGVLLARVLPKQNRKNMPLQL